MHSILNEIKNSAVEQLVLGVLLYDNDRYDEVAEILQPEFFSEQIHEEVYRIIVQFIRQGRIANPLTVISQLKVGEDMSSSEEMKYLVSLVENISSSAHIEQYANIIRDLFVKRKVLNIIKDSQETILEKSSGEIIEKLESSLFDIGSKTNKHDMLSFFQASYNVITKIASLRESNKKVIGTTSGLEELDNLLGGFHPGELIILAGRPSMGKTALAINIAVNAAKDKEHGGPVAFFSLEMPYEQIIMRILSGEIGISSSDLRSGRIPMGAINELMSIYKKFSELKFFIDDTASITISSIRSKARAIKRKYGLSLLVVDYLQLISGKDLGRNETKSEEIGSIAQGLKAIAKELSVPVLALSQLSRTTEIATDDNRPQLSHLRGSGQIEQDADVVFFVYRPGYYLLRKQPKSNDNKWLEWKKQYDIWENVAELLVDKNRNGAIGVIKLHFDGKITKFSDLPANFQAHNEGDY